MRYIIIVVKGINVYFIILILDIDVIEMKYMIYKIKNIYNSKVY